MPGSGGATVLDDLPESIVVEEILLRLAPKDLLRCRAVRKCWHSATSTGKFMLDHHRRQPLLPILSHAFGRGLDYQNDSLFVSRDAGAGQKQLRPVLRYPSRNCRFHAALDGLLIVSKGPEYFICNPVTRKCAPLWSPQIQRDLHRHLVAFYRHKPSGECRVLWFTSPLPLHGECPADENYTTSYSAVAIGSDNPRCVRQVCIPQPTVSPPYLEIALRAGLFSSSNEPPVHHRGSLHWKLGKSYIMVFNTAAETFRLMSSPPAQLTLRELLLEMDNALAFCRISGNRDNIDIWVIQDYDAEIWSFKGRTNLSVVDPPSPRYSMESMSPKMAVLNEDEMLIQFPPKRVLRYDIDGKFLGYVANEKESEFNWSITKHYLRESVIPLPLFHEMREEGGASQDPPFS